MSRSSASVKVGGASAKPRFVYESFARRRSRAVRRIVSWSYASSGRSSTGCQRVSAGICGSTPAGTRPRYAVASSRRRGIPAGVAQRLELLEVREIAHVDLLREVPARRLLERLVRLAGRRPAAPTRPRTAPSRAARAAPAAGPPSPGGRRREPRARRFSVQFSIGSRKPCTLAAEVIAREAKTPTRSTSQSSEPGSPASPPLSLPPTKARR